MEKTELEQLKQQVQLLTEALREHGRFLLHIDQRTGYLALHPSNMLSDDLPDVITKDDTDTYYENV